MRYILTALALILSAVSGAVAFYVYATLADTLRPLTDTGLAGAVCLACGLFALAYACAHILRHHCHKRGLYPYLPSSSTLAP